VTVLMDVSQACPGRAKRYRDITPQEIERPPPGQTLEAGVLAERKSRRSSRRPEMVGVDRLCME
jgi:hypothetical protein